MAADTVPAGETIRSVPARSVTRALPPGKNAMPQGLARPAVISVTTNAPAGCGGAVVFVLPGVVVVVLVAPDDPLSVELGGVLGVGLTEGEVGVVDGPAFALATVLVPPELPPQDTMIKINTTNNGNHQRNDHRSRLDCVEDSSLEKSLSGG